MLGSAGGLGFSKLILSRLEAGFPDLLVRFGLLGRVDYWKFENLEVLSLRDFCNIEEILF